jgi:mannose-1-phosphate guanylyltransferase
MKAFLMAAGLGTRLRPLTATIPKCLMPIGGYPLMHYWITLLARHRISEILVNIHHLPDMVYSFLSETTLPISVKTSFEKVLLGSAGTIEANQDWIGDDEEFLIAYADNLTNANLTDLIEFHKENKPVLTMSLFRTQHPQDCGIATLNTSGTIETFEEKPKEPKSNLANAGIYVATRDIISKIPSKTPSDLGFDVLPNLVGEMKGFIIKEYILDIGNIDNYKKAQRDIERLVFRK